jgi:hypothetical protein
MARDPRSKAAKTPQKSSTKREPRWLVQGARFADALAKRDLKPADFARKHDVRYMYVNRWVRGFDFPPARQAFAATALGLAPNAFDPASEELREAAHTAQMLARREAEAAHVLEAFATTKPIAASLTPADWRILRSIRFLDATVRPSVAFFEAVAYALKGAIRVDEILTYASENDELDRTLSDKPPLRRR